MTPSAVDRRAVACVGRQQTCARRWIGRMSCYRAERVLFSPLAAIMGGFDSSLPDRRRRTEIERYQGPRSLSLLVARRWWWPTPRRANLSICSLNRGAFTPRRSSVSPVTPILYARATATTTHLACFAGRAAAPSHPRVVQTETRSTTCLRVRLEPRNLVSSLHFVSRRLCTAMLTLAECAKVS